MAEYIEREAAIRAINAIYKLFDDEKYMCCRVINNVSAADVVEKSAYDQVCWERDIAMKQLEDYGIPFGGKADVAPVVHGRWIHDINNLYGCSECGGRETMSPKKLKPFCPNCGAKMDGGADG